MSPVEGSKITTEETGAQFTLILDQYNFTPQKIEAAGGSYAGHETETQNLMVFQTEYLIWNNNQGKAIAWGKVFSKKQTYPGQSKIELYSELISEAFSKIVEESPFVPRRVYSYENSRISAGI